MPHTAIDQLHGEILACRKCADDGFPISLPPVVRHTDAAPAVPATFMVVGQAPSLTDLRVGRNYQGPAGKRLTEWLLRAGFTEGEIGTTVCMTALTKCFPGRLAGKSTDRAPSHAERANCRPWLDRELTLLRPPCIIPFGKMAIDTFLRPTLSLDERIGKRYEVGGVVYIPLPHSSGASTWLNSAEHLSLLEEAITLIAAERTTPHPDQA